MELRFTVLPGRLAVSRLAPGDPVPAWLPHSGFTSVTRTDDELSIVCDERVIPAEVKSDGGWRCLRVEGPFSFETTGVAAAIASPLAAAGVSLLLVATFDTDYVLVREAALERAVDALTSAGHPIRSG